MFDCFNVGSSVAMATRYRSTNGIYPISRHIKIAREIVLRNQHRLISAVLVTSSAVTMHQYLVWLCCFFSDCYMFIKPEENWYIKLYNTRKTRRPVGIGTTTIRPTRVRSPSKIYTVRPAGSWASPVNVQLYISLDIASTNQVTSAFCINHQIINHKMTSTPNCQTQPTRNVMHIPVSYVRQAYLPNTHAHNRYAHTRWVPLHTSDQHTRPTRTHTTDTHKLA